MEINNISDGNISILPFSNTTSEMLSKLNVRYANALLPVTIALGLLGFVGIIGNVLVFTVYGCDRKFKDEKIRCYVLVLAIIDFTTCLTLIPAEIWKHQSYFKFVETLLCKLKCFFNVFAASAAWYCLFIVAIDRYILTCHPFLFVKIKSLSHKTVWFLCSLMIFLGVLTAIPAAILCGTSAQHMANANGLTTVVYLCSLDPIYETGVARYIYRIALCFTQTGISLVMIVLYIQIGCAVHRVMKTRNNLPHNALQDIQGGFKNNIYRRTKPSVFNTCSPQHTNLPTNVKLLFLITVVFVVTYFLYLGLSWVDQTTLSPGELAFFSVFFRLYFIHSVINPFLYAKMDKHFRKRCVRMFKACRS